MKKWILTLPLLVMLIGSAGACTACGCSDEGGCIPTGPYSITAEINNVSEYRATMNMLQDEIESSYGSLYAYIEGAIWDIETVKRLLVNIDGLEQELYYLQLKTTTITTIEKHCNVLEDGTCELDKALLASQKEINTQLSKRYQAYLSVGNNFIYSLDLLNDLVQKIEIGGNAGGKALILVIKDVRTSRESYFAAGVSFQEYNILDIILGNIADGQMVLRDLPFCDTPISDFSTYTWYNDWIGVTNRWVWVAYYDEIWPANPGQALIQEVCYCSNGTEDGCSGSFPANDYTLTTYWSNRPAGRTAFMQVKFFYTGRYNAHTRNLIWEMNKTSDWTSATYGEVYTSTSGSGDDYKFGHVLGAWLVCCEVDQINYIWGNTHCGGCFAEDESQSQNFVNDER